MKIILGAVTAAATFSLATVVHAQEIPVLVEEAAAAGWAYGDNGNMTTPQTLSEEKDCGTSWLMLDTAYTQGSFDADLVAAMPEPMNPASTKKELAAWAKRLKKKFPDPIAAFREGVAGRAYAQRTLGKAAAGDPQAMFQLAWNTRSCQIKLAE